MLLLHTGKRSWFQSEYGNRLQRREKPRRVKVLAASDLLVVFDPLRYRVEGQKVSASPLEEARPHASSPDSRSRESSCHLGCGIMPAVRIFGCSWKLVATCVG